jgi:hypothetical protein
MRLLSQRPHPRTDPRIKLTLLNTPAETVMRAGEQLMPLPGTADGQERAVAFRSGLCPCQVGQVAPSHAKPTRWSARCGCCDRKLVNPAGPLLYHPLRMCSSGKMKVRRIGQS